MAQRLKLFPNPEVLKLLRNKQNQKQCLQKLGIPTSPFDGVSSLDFKLWKKKQKDPIVLKWALFGYDGKGTWIEGVSPEDPISFIKKAEAKGVSVYAEKKVSFVRELAVILCVSKSKKSVFYPVVVSEQQTGICRWVYGPATHWGLSPQAENEIHELSLKLSSLDLWGSYALELFEFSSGEIWVNEIAPRVHNSGHYSMDVCPGASQFDNHVRAAFDLDLVTPKVRQDFVMLNILGKTDKTFNEKPDYYRSYRGADFQSDIKNAVVHWYGKKESRKGRKLGHIHCFLDSPSELSQKRDPLLKLESDILKE